MLGEVIKDPMQPDITIRKSNLFSIDRVAILIKPMTDGFRVLPANYDEETFVRKAQGEQAQGYMTKHDILLSAAPDMLYLHTSIAIKNLPEGESMNLQVGGRMLPPCTVQRFVGGVGLSTPNTPKPICCLGQGLGQFI